MTSDPLISVIVLSYNSKDFIVETLDSIFFQSYQSLELIIADDCSQDGSIALVNDWLASRKDRFVRAQVLVPDQNTGTSTNCNRGLQAASGIWIKYIAGDDILDSEYFSAMGTKLQDPSVEVLTGEVYEFHKDVKLSNKSWPNFDFPEEHKRQRRLQIVKGLLLAPSVAVRKSALDSVGGFDTNYRILEDDPMWFKLTLAGYLFHFSPKSRVYYRQHAASVNSIESRQMYYRKPVYLNDLINFGTSIRLPSLMKEKLWLHAFLFYLGLSCERVIFNNGSKLDSILNISMKKFTVLFNKIYLALPF
jgi:glycosyltransferase involved in cell wall biosynthesis